MSLSCGRKACTIYGGACSSRFSFRGCRGSLPHRWFCGSLTAILRRNGIDFSPGLFISLPAATIGLVFAAWVALWEELLNPWALTPGPDPFPQLWMHKFYGGLLSYLVLYGLILMVKQALDAREQLALQQTETARLNEQLSKSQLSALRRQIEPHFLFNTLNAIAGLVREKRNDAAVSMIAGLSDFLRRVVDDSDRQQVPLGEELEFTQKYLDIQKVRFAERLQFSVDVPQELLPAQVPSLILQPMVENAVKHGIAQRVQGGAIRITATRSNGTLTMRVYNDGPSLPVDGRRASRESESQTCGLACRACMAISSS